MRFVLACVVFTSHSQVLELHLVTASYIIYAHTHPHPHAPHHPSPSPHPHTLTPLPHTTLTPLTQPIANGLGLNTQSYKMWKDRAMLELNVSILHSFQVHTYTHTHTHRAAWLLASKPCLSSTTYIHVRTHTHRAA